MLGVIDPEHLIAVDHPTRRIRPLVEAALLDLEPAFDPTRASPAELPVDGAALDPQRAAVLRAAALRPLVQMVPGPQRGGRALRPLPFCQEPHAVAGPTGEPPVLRGGGHPPGEMASRALLAAFHSGWHAAGVLRLVRSPHRRQETGPGHTRVVEGRTADADLQGQRRANETHYSTTDPEARMTRKGLGKEPR